MLSKWKSVKPLDSVQDGNGDVWQVTSIARDGTDVVVDLKGSRVVKGLRIHAERTVTVLLSPSSAPVATVGESAETAIALTQVVLGGRLAALPAPDGGHMCPAEYAELGALVAHVRVFHLSSIDLGQDAKAWEVEHGKLHDQRGAFPPHVHTPMFARDRITK